MSEKQLKRPLRTKKPLAVQLSDPERWLQAIRRLQAQGEIDAARGEVARFQERFPRYAVPEDLAPFLAPGK